MKPMKSMGTEILRKMLCIFYKNKKNIYENIKFNFHICFSALRIENKKRAKLSIK